MDKKKRGSNYTPYEKDMLLDLVGKYQDIIENKETNANIITKKREAWNAICQQYNIVAVSGHRTWQQLRHLYENIKQRSKKTIAKAANDQETTVGTMSIEDNSNPCTTTPIYIPEIQLATVNNGIGPQEKTNPTPSTSAGRSNSTNTTMKQEYFRIKLRNAKLGTKYLINKNRMEMNKYKLEMQILRLRLQKLRSKR